MPTKILSVVMCVVTLLLLQVGCAFRHRPFPGPVYEGPASRGVLNLRYTGIAGFEISDGETTILLDPVITRPTVWALLSGPLEPDVAGSARVFPEADFILIQHAHYDHVIDAPEIALRTGATVLGSQSVANLLASRGVPEEQIVVVEDGQTLTLGRFVVKAVEGRHGPLFGLDDPMGGLIPDDAGPLWFFQYRNDTLFNYRLENQGTSLWSNWPGEDDALPADLVLLMTDRPLTRQRWENVLSTTGATTVIPSHFDNFFQPRSRGLGFLPLRDAMLDEEWDGAEPVGAAWRVLDYDQQVGIAADGAITR